MSYAPAIRGCVEPLLAVATQAGDQLCAALEQLLTAERCEQESTAPKARLAAKQYQQDARRYYDNCAAYSAYATELLVGVIAETKRASVRQRLARKHQCDYLRAARAEQRTYKERLSALRGERAKRERAQCDLHTKRSTTSELCARRRAALVGVAAPVAPPVVMVSNYSGVALAM